MHEQNLKRAVTKDWDRPAKPRRSSGGSSFWFCQFDLLPGSHAAFMTRVQRRRRPTWRMRLAQGAQRTFHAVRTTARAALDIVLAFHTPP